MESLIKEKLSAEKKKYVVKLHFNNGRMPLEAVCGGKCSF